MSGYQESAEKRRTLITKRTAAEMTQRDLAKRMGVSQPFVAAFEAGKKTWPQERYEQALAEIEYYLQEPTDAERTEWRRQIADIIAQLPEVSP